MFSLNLFSELILFDDNVANVESASKVGIDSVLIDPQKSFYQISNKIAELC
jgi:FMN phosphatase YigB (HAD superfamily)